MAESWDFSQITALAQSIDTSVDRVRQGAEVATAKTAADTTRDAKILAPVDTGNLKNSIGYTGRGLSYEVAPTANYAIYMELGTSRAAPQPFMAPALEVNAPKFVQAMGQVAKGAFGG